MKLLDIEVVYALVFAVVFLSSCTSYNRIVSDADYKMQLTQKLDLEEAEVQEGIEPVDELLIVYRFIIDKNDPQILAVPKFNDDIYWNLILVVDGEEFKMTLQNETYLFPDNLWVSLSKCMSLDYNFVSDQGRVGYGVEKRNLRKLKTFLQQAIQERGKIIPVIPEGKAKW